MTISKTLLAVATTAVLAVPASAGAAAGDSSPFNGAPWLAQLSNGAYVDFDLDKTPDHSTVTIDGKRAKVKTIRENGSSFFRAIATKSGLVAHKSYKVTIKVTPKAGSPFTFSKRLVLHVAHDHRPAGTVGA